MLTVATVLWKGEFRNRTYNEEWVRKTQRMCKRLLPEHKFVCLSNVEIDGVYTLPLIDNLPGWWSKVELFRPNNDLKGFILYLDLDTLIVGNMKNLIESGQRLDTPMFMPPSYTFGNGGPQEHPKVVNKYQTSCFTFHSGSYNCIYEDFTPEVMDRFRGDQDWISYRCSEAKTFPPHWFRKLKQCPKGPPAGVKLVLSMPLKNDKAAKTYGWVGKIWY